MAIPKRWQGKHRNRARRGVMSFEYLAILGAIVIPLALLTPMLIHMVVLYTHRVLVAAGLPLG